MYGIELDKPAVFLYSSLRYFSENEYHITRFCEDDVLLLVFDGVLRFSENGKNYEIHPGEYFIQKGGCRQEGCFPSLAPKYLYIHFRGTWGNSDTTVPRSGKFDYIKFKPLIENLDNMCHKNYSYTDKCAVFYYILSLLKTKPKKSGEADKISEFIEKNYLNNITLSDLSAEFHYSKNHIINIFKKEYKITPIQYANRLKIEQAERLLETTSEDIMLISQKSGFSDYPHFYKTFLKKNGVTPTEWRNKKRMNPGNRCL